MSLIDDVKDTAMNKKVISGGLGSIFGFMLADKYNFTAELPTQITSVLELESKVDPSLIGGFVLEFDNNLVDASVVRDLRDIKKQFQQNLYVPQMK